MLCREGGWFDRACEHPKNSPWCVGAGAAEAVHREALRGECLAVCCTHLHAYTRCKGCFPFVLGYNRMQRAQLSNSLWFCCCGYVFGFRAQEESTLSLSALLEQLACLTLIFLLSSSFQKRGVSSVPLGTEDYQNITLCGAANPRHANRVYLTGRWRAPLCAAPRRPRRARGAPPPALQLTPAQDALLVPAPGD